MNELENSNVYREGGDSEYKLHRDKEMHEIAKLLSEVSLGVVLVASFVEARGYR